MLEMSFKADRYFLILSVTLSMVISDLVIALELRGLGLFLKKGISAVYIE